MKPRVHGNGFIQLDLDDCTRLHIWGDPRIPRQKISTPIHSHIFNFKSAVLKGRIVHIEYNLTWNPHGAFEKFEAFVRSGEDTVLEPTGYHFNIVPYETIVTLAGQEYDFVANRFHENFAPEPTVTVIRKDGPTLAQKPAGHRPAVLVPTGKQPDNEFCRYDYSEDLLWLIINENIKDLGINVRRT